jgi:predicted transcriptional regulator
MNRSRMDIAATILDVALGGVTKTRIMYGGALSFPQLKQYLELLSDADLIKHSPDGKYHTTLKGRHFLRVYGSIGHMMGSKYELHSPDDALQVQESWDEVVGQL